MEITVKDRQSLIDIAIIALGSAEGVFSLVKRNGLSLTDTLADGQVLEYEADDIVAPTIRETYRVRKLAPATDIGRLEFNYLMSATSPGKVTGSVVVRPHRSGQMLIDPLEDALADIMAGRPPKENAQIHLTRIFQNPFDDTFA